MVRHQTRKRLRWLVVIPSYRRAELLRDKTLSVLAAHAIPPSRIHVFVADADEAARYRATLIPGTYGHLHVAVPGMAAVRNFITAFFPVGTPLFNIDDDCSGFIQHSPTAKRNEVPVPAGSLSRLITAGFAAARSTGFRLWGFYPVPNGYFMKAADSPPTTDMRYIMGGAWGILNPPASELRITLDDKEDFLRSVIMYVLDGGVLRFNGVSARFLFYTGEGGMQETRTMARIAASAKAMVDAFPGLVVVNTRAKKPEVRLRDAREGADRSFGLAALRRFRLPTL